MKAPRVRLFFGRLTVARIRRFSVVDWRSAWLRLGRLLLPGPLGLAEAIDARRPADDLNCAFLATRLPNKILGEWSLAVDTLDILERMIHTHRPSALLELGSGVSTACLARYMYECHGPREGPFVYSVDQDKTFVEDTMELCRELQVAQYVRVSHAPLTTQVISGRTISYYDLANVLPSLLGEARPAFLVIDGPAASDGARFGALPLLRGTLMPGAWFFLDDAFRPDELHIANDWDRLPWVAVDGILPVGKGLLMGRVSE